ncbi:MAG: hypothetical protein AAGF11_56210 [Myxococcota bacterium]
MAEVVPVTNAAELVAAVAGIKVEDQAVLVLEPGLYTTTVDIGDSTEVAIIGSGVSPTILAGDGARAVEVFGDVTMYLSNVEVSNANVAVDGLECSGRAVWVDDSRLDANRIGIAASGGCFIHARRTAIIENTSRGIECSGGDLSLQLCPRPWGRMAMDSHRTWVGSISPMPPWTSSTRRSWPTSHRFQARHRCRAPAANWASSTTRSSSVQGAELPAAPG